MREDELFERGLPVSLEAERTLLGAVLLDNEVFFDQMADLASDDFALDSHQRIFVAMNEILFGLAEDVTQVDIVTLAEMLSKRKQISVIGGISYLASLTEGLPRRLAVDGYVQIVKDKAKLRRLINICSRTITKAADQTETAQKIAADMQEELTAESAEGDGHAVKIGEVVPEVQKRIERGRNISDERTAAELTWGLSGLDSFTRGAFGGELTVLAGESGGYKTSMMTQMILANAREGTPCGIFSLEMQREKMGQRFYPQMSNIITAAHIRDPRLINKHTHLPEIERISKELRDLPIWIDDTSPLQINKLIARMRMMIRKFGIRLFGIDYLQLIQANQSRTEAEGIKGLSFALRDFVKMEPSVHLLLLSQYSKADGFQRKKRRSRGDLYGSSAIHHAAQNVLLITVEDPEKKESNALLDVEIAIDKQRDGAKGKVTCMLDRDFLRFTYPQPNLTA